MADSSDTRVSSAMLIASLLGIPRVMWIGIAAMSVLLPFRKDMEYRVKFRAPGNILGAICFLVLYTVLPERLLQLYWNDRWYRSWSFGDLWMADSV